MVITRAAPKDAPNILEVQYHAYQSEAVLYNDFRIPPLIQTLTDLVTEFDSSIILIAQDQDRIVGTVRARNNQGIVTIGRLAVESHYQGQGIGSQLLSAIEAHFPQAQQFELFTGHRSVTNLGLYQRRGYRIVREQFINTNLTLIYLRKQGAINNS